MLNQKACFGLLLRLLIFFLILASDDTKNSPKLCFACYCKIRTLRFCQDFWLKGIFLILACMTSLPFRATFKSNHWFLYICILLVIKITFISYISLSRLVMVPFRSLKKTNWLYFKLRNIRTGIKCQKRPTYTRQDAAPGAHFKKLGIGVDIFILTYLWVLLVGLDGQWHI